MNRNRRKERTSSNRFRTELQGELCNWLEEELISDTQSKLLAKRYKLDELVSRTPSSLIVPITYLIGILLIGGGAISFVAAHWESIPAYVRVAMLVTVMLACEITGFYLWKVKGWERLGHSLVTLGTLIFGANIFLIAQIFHIRGDFHNAFGVWALGAAAMAYATTSRQNIWIACIISFIWFCGWVDLNPHAFCWYPFVLIPVCLPFLIRRCVLTFLLLLLATGISVIICSGVDSGFFWGTAVSWVGAAALIYAIGIVMTRKDDFAALAPYALVPGLFGVLLLSYILAFQGPARELVEKLWQAQGWLWIIPAGTVYLAAMAVWTKAFIAPPEDKSLIIKSRVVLISSLLLLSGIVLGQWVLLVVTANLAILGIAASLIWSALAYFQRKAFWSGLSIFILVLLSRFLEWETHLIIKSLVFICCGLLLIWGGARFERYLKRKA